MKIFKKNILLKDEINNWFLFKKNSIKISTYYRYQYIVDKYILYYFKNKSIYFFMDYNFNIYVDELSKNLSAKTIKDILSILKSILKYIERKYNIDYMLDLIASPKQNYDEIQVLKDNEKNKLEKYCLKSNYLKDIGIALCLNTGLRLGEICALTWDNINLKENFIMVNKTIQRVYKGKKNTSIQFDTPKTTKSIRKIPLSNKMINILQNLKKEKKYSGNEYFLTGCEQKYVEPRNYQYSFKKCLKKCNISNYNFHVLRHTFATNCIKIGMDVKSLSELLGHTNINITLNRYVHSCYNTQKEFLDKL